MSSRARALKKSFDAVAVYNLGEKQKPKLADYRHVLATLQGGGNGLFLLKDIKNRLVTETWPEDAPKVLSLLDGSHPSGFRLSIIRAAGEDGEDISMPVIEDPYTKRTLAVGPSHLPEKLAVKLERSGITYVSGRDLLAKASITGFLVSTVQKRLYLQKNGKAPEYFGASDMTGKFVEDVMMAALSTAQWRQDAAVFHNPNPNIADLLLPISVGAAETTIYTAAARKDTPRRKVS